jgi:hypothetical protein
MIQAPSHVHLTISSSIQRPNSFNQSRPFFPALRTHFNIPFPLFSEKKGSTNAEDLEAKTCRFSVPRDSQTVETNIWSGAAAHGALTDEFVIDPTSLYMGTRAYRERERRELESEKAAGRERTLVSQVPEDCVTVSHSLDQTSSVSPDS